MCTFFDDASQDHILDLTVNHTNCPAAPHPAHHRPTFMPSRLFVKYLARTNKNQRRRWFLPRFEISRISPTRRNPRLSRRRASNRAPKLVGRVFIITGWSSGIGFELCRILYKSGATIYLAGRSEVFRRVKHQHSGAFSIRAVFLHLFHQAQNDAGYLVRIISRPRFYGLISYILSARSCSSCLVVSSCTFVTKFFSSRTNKKLAAENAMETCHTLFRLSSYRVMMPS